MLITNGWQSLKMAAIAMKESISALVPLGKVDSQLFSLRYWVCFSNPPV